MEIYHYHSITRQYIGSTPARPNPLRPGEPLVPRHATKIPPPSNIPEGMRAIFNESGDKWEIEAIPSEPEPKLESEEIASFNPAIFVSKTMTSQLYAIAKKSDDPIVQREKAEIQVILGGWMIFAPETIAPGGLLQKNLNELMTALGDVSPDAISEFNQLLANDLGVEWRL
ncbi:MAG: hypothetical protein AAGA60_05135 [Cyanobacteria bacterium P01_E01_bin.42]